MSVLAVAQVEDDTNIREQIAKQTVQPDAVEIYVDKNPATGIKARRKRIAENHQKLKELVKKHDVSYVWQIEGDSVLPENTLERLMEVYQQKSMETYVGYVSGVQVGRHGIYCLGAWHVANDRNSFESLDYKKTGINEVDATGFYCLFGLKNVWLKGESSWTDERYGPDVVWALSLREKGYRIFVDSDLHIGHKTTSGIITPDGKRTCNVKFYKEGDKWQYKTTK